MKIKQVSLGLLALAALGFTACEQAAKDGFTTMGMEYKIINRGSDSTIKAGNVILMNIETRNGNDSIIGPWRQMQLPIGPADKSFPLRDGLFLLGEGDSAIFYMPVDTLFKSSPASRPPFLASGTKLRYHVKIAKRFQDNSAAMGQERVKLQDWAKTNNLEGVTEDENGILYAITEKKSTAANLPGTTVAVNYKGQFLDGRVFDSSEGRDPFNVTLGQGQVIKGWDLGLLHFGIGDKGYLLIPSSLAYGDGGGVFPPNEPLIFQIEVLPAMPAPAAQAPAAK